MIPYEADPDFGPIEDLVQGIFDRYFATVPEVNVTTGIYEGMALPAVIARADRRSGTQAFHSTTDDRFTKAAVISVSAICEGPNGDSQASHLIEACRLGLNKAFQQQWVVPFCGHLTLVDNSTEPARVTDWATSTGIVQYASLPQGSVRYEGIFRILVRPPVGGSGNPFLPVD